jgi:hypothetical protein
VQLGPRRLAQRLRVIYQVQRDPEGSPHDRRVLPAPSLPGLSVTKALWTVRVAGGVVPELLGEGLPADAWRQEVVRFNESAERIESASEVLAEIDPGVAQRWYLMWVRRASASLGKILFWASKCDDLDQERVRESQMLDRRYQTILAGLVEAGLVERSEVEASVVCRSSDIWDLALGEPNTRHVRLITEGQAPVQILHAPGPRGIDRQRWTAVAVVMSLAFAVWLVMPFPGFERWHAHFLLVVAIIAGGMWWYWCIFSFLGLALIAIGLTTWTVCRFFRIRPRFPTFRLGTK